MRCGGRILLVLEKTPRLSSLILLPKRLFPYGACGHASVGAVRRHCSRRLHQISTIKSETQSFAEATDLKSSSLTALCSSISAHDGHHTHTEPVKPVNPAATATDSPTHPVASAPHTITSQPLNRIFPCFLPRWVREPKDILSFEGTLTFFLLLSSWLVPVRLVGWLD
jgi:hypothetical protein